MDQTIFSKPVDRPVWANSAEDLGYMPETEEVRKARVEAARLAEVYRHRFYRGTRVYSLG